MGTPHSLTRDVLTFAFAVALAAVAAHPRVRELEKALGVTVFLASGLPFLLLGALLTSNGVLSPNAISDLQPAYVFGLGWIGFVVGTSFDIRRISRLPAALAPVILMFAIVPMFLTAIVCATILVGVDVRPGAGLIRDVLLLAACAAASAPASLAILPRGSSSGRLIIAMTRLDQLAALVLLAFVAIAFRTDPGVVHWSLPRSAWLLVTLGLGTLFGLLAYMLTLRIHDPSEETAVVAAAVALASGAASFLAISVPVVAAIAGALLVNMPLTECDRLRRILADIERPLYLLFLFIVGTSWRPDEWQGWLLALGFLLSRGYGKVLAARITQKLGAVDLPDARTLSIALMPESAIAIVVIFSAATLAGEPAPAVRWAINAVILGSIATDVLVQLAQWQLRRKQEAVR